MRAAIKSYARSCSIIDGRRHAEERARNASPEAISRNVHDVSRTRRVLPVINVPIDRMCGIRASNRNDGYARSSFAPVHDGSHHGR